MLRPLQRYLTRLAEIGFKGKREEVLCAAQVGVLMLDAVSRVRAICCSLVHAEYDSRAGGAVSWAGGEFATAAGVSVH